jgi:iron complex outermembrane recepter protein
VQKEQKSGSLARCVSGFASIALTVVLLAVTPIVKAQSQKGAVDACLHGVKHFDLESGDARDYLNRFSEQSEVQLLFDYADATGFMSQAVHGDYPVGEALSILLRGIPIKFECVNEKTMALVLTSKCPPWIKVFDIKPGDAGWGLMQFSVQADMQSMYDKSTVDAYHTPEIKGELRIEEVLRRLLEGIPATWQCVDDRTIVFIIAPRRRHWWQPRPDAPLEQVTITAANDAPLANAHRFGSPLLSFSLQDIRQTGAATLSEFLRTIPQVWGGGPTDHTSLGREATMNANGGTGVNLRAMDAGAALVLVNGIRLSPNGAAEYTDISSIPLSSIERIDIAADGPSPIYGADAVSGVINIVTRQGVSGSEFSSSGGSAIGGAKEVSVSQLAGGKWDAGSWTVSGEYYDRQSLPSSARGRATSDLLPWGGSDFRSPYDGSPGTVLGAQGQTWAVPATSGEPFELGTQNLYDTWTNRDILPHQRRGSLMAHGAGDIGDALEVWGDGMVSYRRMTNDIAPGYEASLVVPPSNPYYVDPSGQGGPTTVEYGFGSLLGPLAERADTLTALTAVGAEMRAGLWRIRSQLSHSRVTITQVTDNAVDQQSLTTALNSSDPSTAFNALWNTPGNMGIADTFRTALRYQSVTTQTDLASYAQRQIGGQDDSAAVFTLGAEYRRQTLHSFAANLTVVDARREDLGRSVSSAFAELTAPVGRHVSFSVGARYENHGVEHVTAPKFALRWQPLDSFSVRSTWGRSFRDSNLVDRDEAGNLTGILPLPDPHSTTGFSSVLVTTGNNGSLHSERARNWTAGLDLSAHDGSSVGATYFDITSAGRIYSPTLTASALVDPAFDGVIIRNPTYAQRLAACQLPGTFFGDGATCMTAPIAAIVDVRLQNLDVLRERGIDLTGRESFESRIGKLSVGLNSTYLRDYSIRHGPGDQLISLLNTADHPVDLRARAFASWSRSRWTATASVNYTAPYRNFGSLERTGVPSWTTVDLHLSRRFALGAAGAAYEVSVNAINVCNTLSPFVDSSLGGYDPENGDYTGRMLSATVRASW